MSFHSFSRSLSFIHGVGFAALPWMILVSSAHGAAAPAAFASPASGPQMVWVDLDTDGYADLIRFVPGGAGQCFLNDRAGGFEEASEIPLPVPLYSVQTLDLEGDGAPELILGGSDHAYVVSLGSGGPEVLHRIPAGGPVTVTDYDLDGGPDLAVGGELFRWDGAAFAAVELAALGADEPPGRTVAPTSDPFDVKGEILGVEDSRQGNPVTTEQIADGAISSAKIADGAVEPRHLSAAVRGGGERPGAVELTGDPPGAPGVVAAGIEGAEAINGDLAVTGDLRVHGTGDSYFKGNLGLGTLVPGNPLVVEGLGTDVGGRPRLSDVVGRFKNSSAQNTGVSIDAREGESAKLYLAEDGVSQWELLHNPWLGDGDFQIVANVRDTMYQRLRIGTSGQVGIGSVPPKTVLDVRGSGTDAGGLPGYEHVVARLRNADPAWSTGLSIDAEKGRGAILYWAEDDTAQWSLAHRADLEGKLLLQKIDDDGSTHSIFSALVDGKVGVGHSTPANPLDVQGEGTAIGGYGDAGHVVARVKNAKSNLSTGLSIDAHQDRRTALFFAQEGAAEWALSHNPGAGDDLLVQKIYGDSLVNRLRVTPEGRLGVGISSPGAVLDARGSGTDAGGLFGAHDVVARFKNTEEGLGSAISVDRTGGEGGSEIFFAQDGGARWGLGTQKDFHGISEYLRMGPVSGGAVQDYFRIGQDGQVGIGKPAALFSFPFNPLDVWGAGTHVGGITGREQVVARFKNSRLDMESAISIDSEASRDSRLYLSYAGEAKWSIGNRVDQGHQLEFSWADPASGNITPAITVDAISNSSDSVFVKIGNGAGVPKNALDVRGLGTDIGGMEGSEHVVTRIRNSDSNWSTALSIDAAGTTRPILYFSNNNDANWALQSNSAVDGIFQIRAIEDGEFGEGLAITRDGETQVKSLRIMGGADVVEGFDAGGEAPLPGTVMVADRERPGQVSSSHRPYDRAVVGVVSGARGIEAGLRLGQNGRLDGETPLAIAGRVFVRCSAENGAILPGDLLCSSGSRGLAMKATRPASGAILGKALGRLKEGTGEVLVLIALH